MLHGRIILYVPVYYVRCCELLVNRIILAVSTVLFVERILMEQHSQLMLRTKFTVLTISTGASSLTSLMVKSLRIIIKLKWSMVAKWVGLHLRTTSDSCCFVTVTLNTVHVGLILSSNFFHLFIDKCNCVAEFKESFSLFL